VLVRLLDLFCGGGGIARGYERAGFDVTGWDLHPQPFYPLWDVHQGDALVVLDDVDYCRGFDVIHASCPCQRYSPLHAQTCRGVCRHPDLIGPVREKLERIGRPYVLENVVGAPLERPLRLCGSMFGLGHGGRVLARHRLFESNVPLTEPRPCSCVRGNVVGVYGSGGAWTRTAPGGGGVKVAGADAAAALGVDWTTHQATLAEMVPPAYSEWIGRELVRYLCGASA
jgi:DNA (cytosine-5)-methyltransferase 1